jgi:hypothetical protein
MMSRRELLEALLDKPQYQSLYQHSTSFHASVDLILGMIPGWISAVAAQALQDEARREEAVRVIESQPVDFKWSLDEMRFKEDVQVIEQAMTELVAATEMEEVPEEIEAIYNQGEKGVTAEPVAQPVKPKPVVRKRMPSKAPRAELPVKRITKKAAARTVQRAPKKRKR